MSSPDYGLSMVSTDPSSSGSSRSKDRLGELDLQELDLPKYLDDFKPIKVGGMGAIFSSRRKDDGKKLALKILLPRLLEDPTARKRFLHEARAISLLAHPNIVSIYDYGVSETETPYIVMEFIEGRTLWKAVSKDGPVPLQPALHLFRQCIDALGHAHELGLIHRDLKPSNIMLGEDDRTIKLVDFGVAKFYRDETVTGERLTPLTLAGDVVGTPLFMSPEQCLAKPLDARSDIYSFGCVMYFALTGKMAVDGANAVEIFGKHCTAEVDFSILPEAVRPVVRKCLEKAPIDRYQSMVALQSDLDRIASRGRAFVLITGSRRKTIQNLVVLAICVLLSYAATSLAISIQESLSAGPEVPVVVPAE